LDGNSFSNQLMNCSRVFFASKDDLGSKWHTFYAIFQKNV
jgi:hypothetical protein